MSLRIFLALAAPLALAACGRGGGSSENLGVASGNSLNQAEIDAALGPANQAETVNSPIPENDLGLANATISEKADNRTRQRHRTGNIAG